MELELTRIFVKVAQSGSFSKAAQILGMPKSSVSKAIAKLEKETGTVLMLRTTRSLTLTQPGLAFFEASLAPIAQLEEAQKSLYGTENILAGVVKLTAPEDLGTYMIAPAIAALSKSHPDLYFQLEYTNEVIDLVKEGFDLAVRLGKLSDSNLKVKKAGEVVLIPVSSPRYLKGRKKISLPADLREHDCLSLAFRETVQQRWSFRSQSGASAKVEIKAKVICNQMTSLLQMVLAGGGISMIPSYVASSYLESGKLVRVLADWSSPGVPVSLMSPLAPSSSARLKITVDQIYKALSEGL